MFRKLTKNKKAQNTAEYAILIALVVAGIVAMQTYAQRALQGRVRDASVYLKVQTNELGNTLQYEPYYLTSNYTTRQNSLEQQVLGEGSVASEENSDRTREAGGFQESSYNAEINGIIGGL